MKLKVVIQANSKNNSVVGFQAEALKIKIKSPPVDGEANKALIKFLSEELKIPQKNISLLRGNTAKNKLLEIDTDLTDQEIIEKLMKK